MITSDGKVTAHDCEKLALQLHEDLKDAAQCAVNSAAMPMAKKVKVAPKVLKLMGKTDMPWISKTIMVPAMHVMMAVTA